MGLGQSRSACEDHRPGGPNGPAPVLRRPPEMRQKPDVQRSVTQSFEPRLTKFG